MKKLLFVFGLFTLLITLAACDNNTTTCGEGTTLVAGVCVLEENDDTPNNQTPSAVSCTNETGLHTVPGGKMYTISAWLNWTFIGGHLVTDPDNAWIQNYGAAVFNVKTVAQYPWQGSITQSGMFLTKGCEYTFNFKLRTEAPSIKPDVIVFGETTNGTSYFEETVLLEQNSQTYSFTVIPDASNWISTGVYFGGSKGMVVIEEIQITRNPIGTNE